MAARAPFTSAAPCRNGRSRPPRPEGWRQNHDHDGRSPKHLHPPRRPACRPSWGPPSGFAAPVPGTLKAPVIEPVPFRVPWSPPTKLLRTCSKSLTTPSPPWRRVPEPPDPAPADLAPLFKPPRMPPSTVSGTILGGLNPPGAFPEASRSLHPTPQTPRPPFRAPWIPSTKSATTCSGAWKPIIGPKARKTPGSQGPGLGTP